MAATLRWGHSAAMQSAAPRSVFLVDDSAPVRDRLREIVALGEPVVVVGEAEDVGGAIDGITATRPAVVVLDYQLRDGTGLDVLRGLPDLSGIVVIVLTNHATAQLKAACLAAGARHFLDKSKEFHRLCTIIGETRAPSA
jgi:DNA-binding NarL/FixJ family response regulator